MAVREQTISVMFGNRNALRKSLPAYSLLIVPSENHWNDFGRKTMVDIRVRLKEDEQEISLSGLIGFLGVESKESRGVDQLHELVKDIGDLTVPATDQYHFFTMLPSMDSYRRIVGALTVDGAEAALVAANDLVALGEFRPSNNWLELAIQSNIFSMSFIRDSEAFFAFNNAGSVLRGLEMEELGRLSPTFAIQFQLEGCVQPHAMKFNFDHQAVLPKRVAILIGKNGVGKSQTLGRIARAALDGSKRLTDAYEDGRPLFSRLLAFAPTNEAESVFPVGRYKRPRTWYRRFSLNRSRNSRRSHCVGDMIVQIARSKELIKNKSRWDIFFNSLSVIKSSEQICLPTNSLENPYVGLGLLVRGNEQSLLERFSTIDTRREPIRVIDEKGYPLSSGEISFIRFAVQASLYIENGSLLLLDEPETHLHPNFISRFFALLDHLLSQTGSAAIIATHSVYFVREVFSEQVTVLSIDEEGGVHSDYPRLRTFGADVGAISYFVFGEDEPSQLESEVRDRIAKDQLSWQAAYEKYKDEFSFEFLNKLRTSMEDGA